MPPAPNERQLSSDAPAGIQTGVAISIGSPVRGPRRHRLVPRPRRPSPRPLVSVCLTPHGLHIVRGKVEILVPLNQIKKVERQVVTNDGYRSKNNTVIITFREPTPLGPSVQFLAPMLHTQRVVDELRRRAGFVPHD